MNNWEKIDPDTRERAKMAFRRGGAMIAVLVFAHIITTRFLLSGFEKQVLHGVELVLLMLISIRKRGIALRKIAFALGIVAFILTPFWIMVFYQAFGTPTQKQAIVCLQQFNASHHSATSPQILRQQREDFVKACMQNQRSASG